MINNKKYFFTFIALFFLIVIFNLGNSYLQQNKENLFFDSKLKEIKLKEELLNENQKKLYLEGITSLNTEFNKVYLKTKQLAKDRMINKLDLENKLLDCSLKNKKSSISISSGLTYGNLSLNILDIFCQE